MEDGSLWPFLHHSEKQVKLTNFQKWYYTSVSTVLACGEPSKGWIRFKSTYRTMDAFYNKKYGTVVKRPKFIMDSRTPKQLRVPTFNLGDGWVVQPFVKKTNLKAAVNQINEELKKYPRIKPDVHTGNVGWYDGKAVLFDW